jgi:hypothetical protein
MAHRNAPESGNSATQCATSVVSISRGSKCVNLVTIYYSMPVRAADPV